jgi:hypothetical protein
MPRLAISALTFTGRSRPQQMLPKEGTRRLRRQNARELTRRWSEQPLRQIQEGTFGALNSRRLIEHSAAVSRYQHPALPLCI